MIEAASSVDVALPPAAVFARILDPEVYSGLLPHLTLTRVSPPPIGLGSLYGMLFQAYGVKVESPLEVTEYEEDRVIAFSAHDRRYMAVGGRMMLLPVDDSLTRTTLAIKMVPVHFGAKMIEGVVQKFVSENLRGIMWRLKDQIERHQPPQE